MRPLAILLILIATLLAGCADDPADDADDTTPDPSQDETEQAVATVVVDHGDIRDDEGATEDTVAYDPDSRPSMDRYNETGTPRPDTYTVHDLMLDWSRESGTPVTIEHHAATGYSVTAIDGVTANTTPGGRWHWALHVDGEPTTAGMGTLAVEDGAEYLWVFTHSTD